MVQRDDDLRESVLCGGGKTVAYEIAADLGWRTPGWIVVPVGAGPLLVGIWKGFVEMQRAGLVNALPRLLGAQATGCAPIVRAYEGGEGVVRPWESPQTVATGIQDPLVGYTQDGTLTLSMIRQSRGMAVTTPDGTILEATRLMCESEGLYVEPTVGAALAAAVALRNAGSIHEADEVVILSTGHGLKQPFASMKDIEALPEIDPALESLAVLDLFQ